MGVWIMNLTYTKYGTPNNRCQLSCRYLFRQHMIWQHLSISAISQLLLHQFLPTFKGFWARLIFNRYHITRVYLSWWHLSMAEILNLLLTQFLPKLLIKCFLAQHPYFISTNNFCRPNLLFIIIFMDPNSLGPKISLY